MEKILLIAFGPQEMTWADSEVFQTNGCNAFANGQDRLIVELLVSNDSAGANFLAAQFELRLDEDEKVGAGFCRRQCGRDYFPDGDERNINHTKIDRFRNVLERESSRIDFFEDNHARIVAQFPIQLTVPDIDRIYFCGAAL